MIAQRCSFFMVVQPCTQNLCSGLNQVMSGVDVAALYFDMGAWSDGEPVKEREKCIVSQIDCHQGARNAPFCKWLQNCHVKSCLSCCSLVRCYSVRWTDVCNGSHDGGKSGDMEVQ